MFILVIENFKFKVKRRNIILNWVIVLICYSIRRRNMKIGIIFFLEKELFNIYKYLNYFIDEF